MIRPCVIKGNLCQMSQVNFFFFGVICVNAIKNQTCIQVNSASKCAVLCLQHPINTRSRTFPPRVSDLMSVTVCLWHTVCLYLRYSVFCALDFGLRFDKFDQHQWIQHTDFDIYQFLCPLLLKYNTGRLNLILYSSEWLSGSCCWVS